MTTTRLWPSASYRRARKRSLLRTAALRLGIAAFGLAIALVLTEVGLRLARPLIGDPLLPMSLSIVPIWSLDGRSYVEFDADLGWVPTPNYDGADPAGIHYRNNRDSQRAEHSYALTPADGVQRVAAYGDSFTYCVDAQIDECWARRLEELLPHSEVLNFGVPAYGTDQAWLRYQRDGSSWQPCAVLIGHMTENINRVVSRFRPFYTRYTGAPLAKPRFLVEGDHLALLPNPARQLDDLLDPTWVETNLGPYDFWYAEGVYAPVPLDRIRLFRYARTALYHFNHRATDAWTQSWAEQVYEPGMEPFEVLTRVLVGFANQVRADGATPVVVVFPQKLEISTWDPNGRKPHAQLLAFLSQRGIPTLDLTDVLGEEAARSGVDNVVADHYRPLGNEVVARTLASELPRLTAETCGNPGNAQ